MATKRIVWLKPGEEVRVEAAGNHITLYRHPEDRVGFLRVKNYLAPLYNWHGESCELVEKRDG